MKFEKIDPRLNLPEEEELVLKFWQSEKIFEKTLKKEAKKGNFVFYEGPPTANGQPGLHHVLARAFKDAFARYKTMQGYYVKRKAGWDTHGLPVELQVEKELGISGKGEIENIVQGDRNASIEKFNQLCRESVWRYQSEWEKLTERMAYWVELNDPYITYDAKYIETVWWIIGEIDKKGLLYKGHKIVPYCPRCGTALSSHEVAQGYKNIKEESVYVKIKSQKDNLCFLVWTTTPWTLAGNAALAFGPNIDYALVEKDGFKYILAQNRIEVLGDDAKIIQSMTGREVVENYSTSDIDYEPIYPDGADFSESGKNIYKLITADYVSDADGTGIVHIAPAFGEDDYLFGYQQNGIKVLKTVDEKGTELAGAGRGIFVKDADALVKADLMERGILFRKEMTAHDYPFCWRCDSPLLYFARDSWFIAMSQLRQQLAANNNKIKWNPDYIKYGRFGNWLENAADWALSRDRYWGTPLPVWICEDCGEKKVVSNYDTIAKESNQKLTKIIFVRHGESEKNVKGIISDSLDKWPLTEKGRVDTEEMAAKINEPIDLIITSPILRAKQTAEILNKKFSTELIEDDLLKEIGYGEWNNLSDAERKNLDTYLEYAKIKSDPKQRYDFKTGVSGESRQDVENRMEEFVHQLNQKYAGKTVLVVAHGINYAMLRRIFDNISIEKYFALDLEAPNHDQIHSFYLTSKGKAFDPHKPFIDEITFSCKCGGEMLRTSEVMDVWLDSGTMPFSQYHFPFENKELQRNQYPADFICEAVDQTRGWFYTLLAISTLINGDNSYKSVICTGHILDQYGKKMSKSKGNIVLPGEAFDKYGADVIRYFMYSVNQPGEPKLYNEKEVLSISRNLFMTLWNVYSFFMMYASIDGFEPKQSDGESQKTERNVLDKWILAKLQQLVNETTASLDDLDPYRPCNQIIAFVAELSTWYVRRSRRRFWKSESDTDKASAYETLYFVLKTLTKLLAPFTPMFAEAIYQKLRQDADPFSVHLAEYPAVAQFDQKVLDEMSKAKKIVEEGLSIRAAQKVKIRQPLSSLTYVGKLSKELEEIIADEVNVKSVNSIETGETTLDLLITPELKREGLARELVRQIQALRKNSGFEVEDHITVSYTTDSQDLAEVFIKEGNLIGREVLANSVSEGKS
ncbi:MAG: class I tRNA ligase family protein, partial [Candidatus Berkelbacteria bacterium]|nr:class I tRNA ligase family protein [Candidatus Berkelbacteria bacterium]